MIPKNIEDKMVQQRKYVNRQDSTPVRRELLSLGVKEGSEAFLFYSKYIPEAIRGTSCPKELLDPTEPCDEMRVETDFVREHYGVAERFVCITSAEGEGFFLLDTIHGGVYDIGLQEVEGVNRGEIAPTWPSFFAFVDWLLP